ncbi:MAG: flagellar hook-basal body complex protein FliE, partial [Pseudolabrys sp.]
GGQAVADSSFASVLKDAISSVAEMGRKSDAQTPAAATGKANIVDVVTAVSETEVAIDAVVAVRDRVIQAYEDIMKMPI